MSSYELGFDDIARTVNSAVGTGARRSVEIGNIEPTDRGKTRPRYFTSRASSSAIMNASMGAITRNYTRRRVPRPTWKRRQRGRGRGETRVHPIFAEYTRSRGG